MRLRLGGSWFTLSKETSPLIVLIHHLAKGTHGDHKTSIAFFFPPHEWAELTLEAKAPEKATHMPSADVFNDKHKRVKLSFDKKTLDETRCALVQRDTAVYNLMCESCSVLLSIGTYVPCSYAGGAHFHVLT